MKKNLLITIGTFVLLAIFFNFTKIDILTLGKKSKNDTKTENQKPNEIVVGDIPEQKLPLSNDSKDMVWGLFQKYLSYNKNKNLEGVKSIVYKLSPVCMDPKTQLDCYARMALAYQYGSVLKEDNLKNFWMDEKQIILSSDFWEEQGKDTNDLGRYRSIISFIKDEKGEWKLLSFSPFKGVLVSIGQAPIEEVKDRVARFTEDKDMDGKSDYEEECLGANLEEKCEKTNPKIRDTDGDGLWDGIEDLL